MEKSWSFIFEADDRELYLIEEAIDKYKLDSDFDIADRAEFLSDILEALGYEECSYDKFIIRYARDLSRQADTLFYRFSANFVNTSAVINEMKYANDVESAEIGILNYTISESLKIADENQRKEFVQSGHFANYDISKLSDEILLRSKTSDTFARSLPYLALKAVGISTIGLPLPYEFLLVPIFLLLPPLSLLIFYLRQRGARKNIGKLLPLIIVLISIRREHLFEFNNAGDAINYLDSVIRTSKADRYHAFEYCIYNLLIRETKEHKLISKKMLKQIKPVAADDTEEMYVPDYKWKKMKAYSKVLIDHLYDGLKGIGYLFYGDGLENSFLLEKCENSKILVWDYDPVQIDKVPGVVYIPLRNSHQAEINPFSIFKDTEALMRLYFQFHDIDDSMYYRMPKDGELFDYILIRDGGFTSNCSCYLKNNGYFLVSGPNFGLLTQDGIFKELPGEDVLTKGAIDSKDIPDNLDLTELLSKVTQLETELHELKLWMAFVRHNLTSYVGRIVQPLQRYKNHPELPIRENQVDEALKFKSILVERMRRVGKGDYGTQENVNLILELKHIFSDDIIPFTVQWDVKDSNVWVKSNRESLSIDVLQMLYDNINKHAFPNATAEFKDANIVEISVKENGDFVEVRISNNGEPFAGSIEDSKKVFELLQKFNSHGDGIGMYSIKKCMETFGGSVDFISTPHKFFKVTCVLNFLKS